MPQNTCSPRSTSRLTLCAVLCLIMLSASLAARTAHAADEAFATYSATVKGLSGEQREDMQKAAKAFIVYLETVLKSDKKLLLPHLDDPLLVEGKSLKKDAVSQKLNTVFNNTVLQCVQTNAPKEPVFVRNMVEYMVGNGCIWFAFTDDDPARPYIFAVNNTPMK